MESAVVSTPAPSAPAPSAPSSGSSSSASTAATPTASTSTSKSDTGSKAQSGRELAREYAAKAAEKLGLTEPKTEAIAPASEIADGETTLAEVTEPSEETEKAVEAKKSVDKTDESSPKDPQSLKISEALKAIPDKKIQNEIRGLAYTGKEFRDMKMTPAEGKELRSMFPSIDVAKQANESARVAYDLAQAFHSGTPEGFDYVMQNFQQANPAAFNRLIEHFAEKLPQASKQSFDQLGRKATTNLIGNLQRQAEAAARRGDDARAHEYATTAQILSEFVFPNGFQQPRQANPNDPVARENAMLKAQQAEFQQQQRQGLIQSVNNGYNQALSSDALSMIKGAAEGTPYPQKALERMADDVVNRVRDKVNANEHVRIAVINHLNQGNGRAAQDYLTQTARQYLASEAADVLRDYAETFGAVQTARVQKQEQAIAKKDVGGAPVAAAPADKPLDTRGMDAKQLFKAALKKRGIL